MNLLNTFCKYCFLDKQVVLFTLCLFISTLESSLPLHDFFDFFYLKYTSHLYLQLFYLYHILIRGKYGRIKHFRLSFKDRNRAFLPSRMHSTPGYIFALASSFGYTHTYTYKYCLDIKFIVHIWKIDYEFESDQDIYPDIKLILLVYDTIF